MTMKTKVDTIQAEGFLWWLVLVTIGLAFIASFIEPDGWYVLAGWIAIFSLGLTDPWTYGGPPTKDQRKTDADHR